MSSSSTSIFSLCSIAATILVFVAAEINAQTRATYGESCSRTMRCDSRSSLTCTNGTCECMMPDVMNFDGTKCAVFAGEKCTFTAVDIQSRGEERSWREELPCVKNSWCQDGFCTCLPEFYESTNGTCLRKGGYQDECEFDMACKTDQFLACNEDKKCGCKSTLSIYAVSRQRCVAVANASCDGGQECVPNAKCIPDGLRAEKICKCDSGYFPNPKGECEMKRGYNEPCVDDNYCKYGSGKQDLQLFCNTDGLCRCKANRSTYDISKSLCVRLAGETCSGFPNCVKNSDCSSNSPNPVCTCSSEFFQTSVGTCERKRNHGKPCEADDSCSKDLKCGFNGLCECNQKEKVFDPSRGKCVGLANSPCSYLESDCVANSQCSANYHYHNSVGKCNCVGGYTKSQNGSCMASHGRACGLDWTSACNNEQGTVCTGGVCKCKYENFQTFDSSSGKCVSSVPGPCDDSIPCVSNAHCSKEDDTFRQCKCDDGFVLVEGYCLLDIGQSCGYSYNPYDEQHPFRSPGDTCDPGAPLQCIAGTCQCGALEEYDYETKKCRGLVGSRCDGKQDYCSHNADCKVRRARYGVRDFGLCKCKSGWLTTRTKRCIMEISIRDESQAAETREENVINPSDNSSENPI